MGYSVTTATDSPSAKIQIPLILWDLYFGRQDIHHRCDGATHPPKFKSGPKLVLSFLPQATFPGFNRTTCRSHTDLKRVLSSLSCFAGRSSHLLQPFQEVFFQPRCKTVFLLFNICRITWFSCFSHYEKHNI